MFIKFLLVSLEASAKEMSNSTLLEQMPNLHFSLSVFYLFILFLRCFRKMCALMDLLHLY